MTMDAGLNMYQMGLKLAEAGRHQEALEHIQQYLSAAGDDTEALNDAGAILHCLGRSDEAIEHFIKAKTLNPDSAEIVWNLVETYLAVDRAMEVVQLFDDMQRKGILSSDILNRTANIFLNQNNKADAIEILLRSLQIAPEQEVLKPMVDVIRYKRPKIAFFSSADSATSLSEIINFTEKRFPVRIFQNQDERQFLELMKWSDISWFQSCTDLAVAASKISKVCKNIISLNSYDVYGQWPPLINWVNIDVIIAVDTSRIKDVLVDRVANFTNQASIVTIPSGINLEKFKFVDRQKGKNIAFLSNLSLVKNPAFMLQCMQKLHYIDPEYHLFFGGVFHDLALEQYLRHMVQALELTDVVFFDGWQYDVNSWLEDKHYIVSTSIIENQQVEILEGMACGLKPIIHNFPGVSQIFPSEFLFNISEEFCQQVISGDYQPHRYRRFVQENYPLNKQLSKINDILVQLEAEISSQFSSEIADSKSPLKASSAMLDDKRI
jgi:glycosyltransferase involved in cell wall biosynthesis